MMNFEEMIDKKEMILKKEIEEVK